MKRVQYVATINPSGEKELKNAGVYRCYRFVFFEDDEPAAHRFFRRYIRNLYEVRLMEQDYSIYAPPASGAS